MNRHLEQVLKLVQQSAGLAADEKTSAAHILNNIQTELESYAQQAKLEEALERVRSKTMTMRNSHDVAETVAILFDEMLKLGVNTIRSGIGIMQKNMQMEIWTSNIEAKENAQLIVGIFDMNMHPMFQGAYRSWQNKDGHFSYELKGDDLMAYYTAVNNMPGYKTKYNLATVPRLLFHNSFHFTEGTLFVFSLEQLPAGIYTICKRFAGVFGQTYRRYLDLLEAEEQRSRVEEKNKEITDSITYAKRIQTSLLTSEKYIEKSLKRLIKP